VKVKVELSVVKSIMREGLMPDVPETVHSTSSGLGAVEVEVPDEWLTVLKVVPNTYIKVEVHGDRVVKGGEKP
jgi:hypothetical protein